ncbi:MAG: pentapeptide repeat-containing protein [Ardenticatenaceae bacterium]|nr:pentapeptide repeat-containing protein [Anaerolineales bacterium]MCB9005910.1 pentapeptide repeat-containing protein [Ardenticatenaceae bacterium]
MIRKYILKSKSWFIQQHENLLEWAKNIRQAVILQGKSWIIAVLVLTLIVFLLLQFFDWGFKEILIENSSTSEVGFYQPPKTVWDILEVIILPAVVALVIFHLDKRDKNVKQQIANEERRQIALTGFIDRVSDLVLNHFEGQRLEENRNAKQIYNMLRAWLTEIVKDLDGVRKGQLVQLLHGFELLSSMQYEENDNENNELKAILDGVDFSGVILKSAKLEEIDLLNASMEDADLKDVELRNSQFKNTNLSRANLNNVNLTDSCLNSVFFENSTFENVQLNNALIEVVNFSNTHFTKVYLNHARVSQNNEWDTEIKSIHADNAIWTDVRLDEANLDNAFLEKTQFIKTSFLNVRLVNANLQESNLSGCDLTGANLTGSTLQKANLKGATLVRTNFSKCKLHGVQIDDTTNFGDQDKNRWFVIWQLVNGHIQSETYIRNIIDRQIDMTMKDYWKALLIDADLSESNLAGMDLRGLDMQGVNLTKANLSGTDLSEANFFDKTSEPKSFDDVDQSKSAILKGAIFRKARLNKADLRYADLEEADFTGADLSGVDFTNSRLNLAKFHQTIIDEHTKFHQDWQDQDQDWQCVWRSVNDALNGVDLVNKTLSDADLSGSDFSKLSNKACSGTNFDRSNLSGASFKGCRLDGATFRQAVLDRADFSGTTINIGEIKKQAKSYKGTKWPQLTR